MFGEGENPESAGHRKKAGVNFVEVGTSATEGATMLAELIPISGTAINSW